MRRPSRLRTAPEYALPSLIFLSIAGVLAAIYYIPPTSLQLFLALDHTDPQPHAFWTYALIHEHKPWDRHLWGNIASFLLLVFPTWKLYDLRDQQRWFWTGFLLILTVGPLVTIGSGFLAFDQIPGVQIQYDRGFSGVVGAFNGFLILTIVQTFARKQEEPVAILSAVGYLAYLLLALHVVTRRYEVAGVGLFVYIVLLFGTLTRYVASGQELSAWGAEHRTLSGVLVVAAVVSALVFAALLPQDIVNSSGGLTNVVAHGAGIVFGLMVEIVVRYRYEKF